MLLDLLLLLYGVIAPGLALGHVSFGARPVLERVVAGLTLGLFVVPLLHFIVAIALHTHLTGTLIAADATVILIACAALTWRAGRL